KDDDFVLIAGWEFWQYRSLVDRVYSETSLGLPSTLRTAKDNGAEVRVLAFGKGPPGCDERTRNFVNIVNDIEPGSAYLAAPKDFAMSHHQKEVFIGTSDFKKSYAYVGGIDLAVNRFDEPGHTALSVEYKGRNYGWHDVQVKVQGDALVQ